MADNERLDMALDDIIKVKNKEERRKRGATRTPLQKKPSATRTTGTRNNFNKGARTQTVNNFRGLKTSVAPNRASNRRTTYASSRAKVIARRAIQRTQTQLHPRQMRNRNNTNRVPPKATGLRITVNASTPQGALSRNGIRRNPSSRLGVRTGLRPAARAPVMLRLGQRRTLPGRRTPSWRQPTVQRAQVRQQTRLTIARRTNQVHTANVVAQRRGMQFSSNNNNNRQNGNRSNNNRLNINRSNNGRANNNRLNNNRPNNNRPNSGMTNNNRSNYGMANNNRANTNKPSTLNDRFTQQRTSTGGRQNTGGRRVVSYRGNNRW